MNALTQISCESVSSGSYSIQCTCGGLEAIDRWANDWTRLCNDAAEDQPFYRPEWIKAYVRRYGEGARTWIITASLHGRLCLLLPLLEQVGTYSKVPVRRLFTPVNGVCSRFDAVRVNGPEGDAAIGATWRYLAELRGWDVLQFKYAMKGSTAEEIVANAGTDAYPVIHEACNDSPFVELPLHAEGGKIMPRNSKLRSQLRQLEKRLAERGTVKFSRIDVADPHALERFYRLEASGWKGKMRTCALYDGSTSFYNEVANAAERSGYFSQYTLEVDERLIAAHLCFVHRGRCYSPKVAYDEEFKPYAPGHLIIAQILGDCVERGVRCYDITGEDQAWKMKWATGTRAVNHYWIFKGALGNIAHTVRFRLRPTLGRMLRSI
jgi:CelD/BcsL family acetyltransferase involved in cellulose biosynthesis